MTGAWPPAGLPGAVRDTAKGTGWSAWSGTLTRTDKGIAYHAYEFAGQARFLAKPVAWDLLLWRLLTPEAEPRRSPSFHFRGVHAPVPILARRSLRARDVPALSAEMLDFAAAVVRRVAGVRLDDFPTLLQLDVERSGRDDFAVSEVLWHLSEGRAGAAREIAEAVVEGARRPSLQFGAVLGGRRVSFFEAVLDHTTPGN